MRCHLPVAVLLALCAACAAAAPADRIVLRPWVATGGIGRVGDMAAAPVARAAVDLQKGLLEDARRLVSGMVYGWTFAWIPGDRARQVEDSFTLTPVASVAPGSPRLRVLETGTEEARLWARIAYALDDDEARRREAWGSATALLSTGQGSASIVGGSAARQDSLRAAIRDAIRRALDTRWVNKPRRLTGDVVLWDDPHVIMDSGAWITTARVKLLVRDIVAYRIF